MAEHPARGATANHLSIGEVLALLLEEFPDVTISKIRFLESQGLIDPERTPSGYRKFYDDDVELLRCILREQRENYLPLRVIKDRLDSGEIDPTGETPRPRGILNVPDPASHPSARSRSGPRTAGPTTGNGAPADAAAGAPAGSGDPGDTADRSAPSGAAAFFAPTPAEAGGGNPGDGSGGLVRPTAPGMVLTPDEIESMSGLSGDELAELISYGVVAPGPGGSFTEDALEIAVLAKRFLDAGVDARHLRGWRVAADREAGLFEQLIQPLLRQRNPASQAQAVERLAELEQLGGQLRTALMRIALAPHLEE